MGYELKRKDERLRLEGWTDEEHAVDIYFVMTPVTESLKDYWRSRYPDLVRFLSSRSKRAYVESSTKPPSLVIKL